MSPARKIPIRHIVEEFLCDEIVDLIDPPDPFGIDHDCISPAGHQFIGSCGDVVCVHCAKVVWQ